jgi:hypothetical protein
MFHGETRSRNDNIRMKCFSPKGKGFSPNKTVRPHSASFSGTNVPKRSVFVLDNAHQGVSSWCLSLHYASLRCVIGFDQFQINASTGCHRWHFRGSWIHWYSLLGVIYGKTTAIGIVLH